MRDDHVREGSPPSWALGAVCIQRLSAMPHNCVDFGCTNNVVTHSSHLRVLRLPAYVMAMVSIIHRHEFACTAAEQSTCIPDL